MQHPEYILADSGSDAHVCNERFAPSIPTTASQKTSVKLFGVRKAEMPIAGVQEKAQFVLGDETGSQPTVADLRVGKVRGLVMSLGLRARKGFRLYLSETDSVM